MICSGHRLGALLALTLLLVASCDEGLGPQSSVDAPRSLLVEPISLNSIRLTWDRVDAEDLAAYRIERRANLTGAFEPLPDQVVQPPGDLEDVVFFDTDVEPDTYYGYRVISVTRFGDRSRASTVGGTRTPPRPGIVVTTRSTAPNSASLDPDGYRVRLSGPDSLTAALGLNSTKRFSPLRPGAYTVALEGVHSQCAVIGNPERPVTVVDTGISTVVGVEFQIACRDPSRGEVVAIVQSQGDSLPASYDVTFVGLAADETLPDTARIVSRRQKISGTSGGATTFANVRPGSYEVALDSVASHCLIAGPAIVPITLAASQIDTVIFDIACQGSGNGGGTGPYAWINEWSATSAAPGSRVTLLIDYDATASPDGVVSVQGEIRYDPAVLRFETYRAVPGGLDGPLWNSVQPGILVGLSIDNAGTGKTGIVPVSELEFTVIGVDGTRAITRTTVVEVVDRNFIEYSDSTRVIEDTLQVGTGSGGGNQSPTAEANGPYSGTTGTPVSFTAAGSNDPDGALASHAWTFGDGSSGSGASPTHAYTSPGTYTATLTVTDDEGATASDQATVTITTSGGGGTNLPPVAEANGPYSGIAGQPIAFSASGSLDPDGTVVSYQWSFGDGTVATGASASHAYQTAGTYTATLTVVDDQGSTATDAATVTVAGGGSSQSLLWSYSAAPPDQNGIVAVTISYDMRADIPETPGAEALQSWSVSALEWDPAVLQYFAFNFGPGGGGSVNPTDAPNGKLVFSGTQPPSNSTGLITIATIRFKVIGAVGSETTTQTTLGPLVGTPATGSFNYTSRTQIVEATIIR